ncbi:MAG: tripartite tricarboxylate transporter substrate binding protein [Burkholderiaceae bacterium]|nr:tripartite tricarboxylate transporter substrate binding protein [Burkholderiaceae bacterium]
MRVLRQYLAPLCLAALLSSNLAWAQAWPAKTIQMIVPQGAGGSTDALARVLSQALGDSLGQTVVVDNRAGAGGTIGVNTAAKAAADGYTILLGSNTTMAANTFLYASFSVDPLKDFVPLALVADAPFAIVVPATSAFKTLNDLVAAAKAAPGKLNYGSGTSSALLCTELFKLGAGIDLAKVPYKASPQALTDLIGGQLQVLCEPLSTGLPLIRNGRLRALAQTGATRSSLAPDFPTFSEAGTPGVVYTAWVGLYAPAAVPADIVARLRGAFLKIVQDPVIGDKIRAIGFDPRPGDSEALSALHRAEMTKVGNVVKAAGIKAE